MTSLSASTARMSALSPCAPRLNKAVNGAALSVAVLRLGEVLTSDTAVSSGGSDGTRTGLGSSLAGLGTS